MLVVIRVGLSQRMSPTVLHGLGEGDAGENIYWLCYTITDGKPPQRFWIIASGEMGGPEHDITRSHGTSDDGKANQRLPVASTEIAAGRGIWLGAPATSSATRLRKEPNRNGEWRGYLYLEKAPRDCKPDGFDVSNSLAWSATDGVISRIVAGQVTSC
jgi:hypothetical protein